MNKARERLILDLWSFIEDTTPEDPDRDEKFFKLRERVRALPEAETPDTPPKVLIYMEGGLIQDVSVSQEMEVLILDHDTEGGDEENIKTIKYFPGDGREEEVYVMDKGIVQATPEWVEHYFNEARKESGE